MKLRNRPCVCVASLLLVSAIFQACSTLPTAASAPAIRTSQPAAQAHSPVISPIPSPTPIPTPATTTVPATPKPAVTVTPTTPIAAIGYVLNSYTASDGKTIYYSDGSHVCRMALDGTNVRQTAIKRFHRFVAVTQDGLYFEQYDTSYKLTQYERNFQFCNSYNLQYLDRMSGKVKTIRKQIVEAILIADNIYTIDHVDHSNILLFDLKTTKTVRVAGTLPPDDNHYQDIGIVAEKEVPVIYCDAFMDDEYIIWNNRIQKQPDLPAVTAQVQNVRTQCGADGIIQWGSQAYRVEVDWDIDDNPNGKIDIRLMHCNSDSTETKILSKDCEQVSVGTWCELVNGWIFVFWDSAAVGGTADEIIFQYWIP